MNILLSFVRGILIGGKGIILLYIMGILLGIFHNISIFIIVFIFGLLNGFIDALIISLKNKFKYKIFSGILGFIITVSMFKLSLILNLPDILADYFIYGKGGGGLEPGGWFAFNFMTIIYFCMSLFLSFPITMILFSKKDTKNFGNGNEKYN